jgi:hypothetical protein
MAWEVECAAGHKLVIPEQRTSGTIECPKCGSPITINVVAAPRTTEINIVPDARLSTSKTSMAASEKPVSRWKEVPSPSNKDVTVKTTEPTLSPTAPVTTPTSSANPHASTAFHLGLLVAAVAFFGMAPAVWEWIHLWQSPSDRHLPTWIMASMLTSLVLFAYGIFLMQLPDWSSFSIVTVALLAMSAGYAAILATTLLGSYDTSLIAWLNMGDKLAGLRATLWCGIMLALNSLAAYFVGFEAIRWHRMHVALTRVASP